MPVVETRDGPARLFQFVGRSIEKILPRNATKLHIANMTSKVRKPEFFTNQLEVSKHKIVFIEFGPVDFNYLEPTKTEKQDTYSISRYPLSASMACVKVLTSFEEALGVI